MADKISENISEQSNTTSPINSEQPRELPAAAKRALAEAQDRREKAAREEKNVAIEHGGRDGPEPVRFGDWERKGIAVDF